MNDTSLMGRGPEGSTPQGEGVERLSMLNLMANNKGLATGVLALLVVMLAFFVVEFLGPRAGPISDSTSCSQWSSASQTQQSAYAGLYVKEHGSLRSGASDTASVETAINNGCMQAFGSDVADTVTVVRAIAGGV